MEVLERCPAERSCEGCPLWEECRGVAKHSCDGHLKIDDAISLKQRVSVDTWQSELLCRRHGCGAGCLTHLIGRCM